MPDLVISEPAEADIQSAYDWWRLNRSAEQAERWFEGIYAIIRSLPENPGAVTQPQKRTCCRTASGKRCLVLVAGRPTACSTRLWTKRSRFCGFAMRRKTN